jgi:hypothetical protein
MCATLWALLHWPVAMTNEPDDSGTDQAAPLGATWCAHPAAEIAATTIASLLTMRLAPFCANPNQVPVCIAEVRPLESSRLPLKIPSRAPMTTPARYVLARKM